MNYVKKYLHNPTYVWHEIIAGVYYLCGLATFCVLRELIFAIWTEWFFLLGIIFAIFRKYPVPSVDNIFCIFFLSENVQQKYILSNTKKKYFIAFFLYRFVSEWKRQVVIEQKRFLSTVLFV